MNEMIIVRDDEIMITIENFVRLTKRLNNGWIFRKIRIHDLVNGIAQDKDDDVQQNDQRRRKDKHSRNNLIRRLAFEGTKRSRSNGNVSFREANSLDLYSWKRKREREKARERERGSEKEEKVEEEAERERKKKKRKQDPRDNIAIQQLSWRRKSC